MTYRLVFTEDETNVEFDGHNAAQALAAMPEDERHREAQLWRDDGWVCNIRRGSSNSWAIV